jgi:hypothetical protein
MKLKQDKQNIRHSQPDQRKQKTPTNIIKTGSKSEKEYYVVLPIAGHFLVPADESYI